MGTRCADHVTPLYPQKLALTSPTGGGRSVGIVRLRTKATESALSTKSTLLPRRKTRTALPNLLNEYSWRGAQFNIPIKLSLLTEHDFFYFPFLYFWTVTVDVGMLAYSNTVSLV